VLRGGSWRFGAQRCRSAYRYGYDPAFRIHYFGFRPVLSPVKQREAQGVLPPEPEAAAQPEPEVQEEAARSVRPHFVPIKGGTFLMGSPETEEGRFDQEDLHQVALTRDFEIADAPVTQAQYEAVMGSNPSQFKDSGPDAPVETVSWEDAVAFCEKLTAEDPEWIYRLPTEAQWEYACRAGTKGRWNVDGADLKDLGWYDENSEKKTHPVRQKQPNAWGLHDCHGNVFEWCQDWFTEHLGATAVTDPQGPEIGSNRVLRGGSWYLPAQYCRSAFRFRYSPDYRDIGFRPVRMKKAEGTVPEPVPTQEAEVKAGARSSAWIARDFDVPPAPGMKMLCIGAGDFAMGEGSEAHPVTLTEDFFVAETPVTQAQYEAVMGTNPSHFKQVGPEGPVEQVSWEDAVAFCARLNQIAEPEDGWEWALPTEAQWEYACRAGTTTAFSFGDVLNGTQANCDGNHPEGTEEKGAYLKRTSPVRSYAPNPWGLYDCHGNVWEWCADWYGKYPKEAVADPQGAESGADRVLRGGSWYGEAQRCRSANRLSYTPDYRGNDIGFRPVLTRKKQAEGTEPEPAPTQEAEVKAGARSRRADYVAADFANGLGMGMVCVEPGAFAMGSPVGGEGRESESWMGKETQHPVTLTEPFWIAKTPLTQGIWSTLMGTTVAEQKAKGSAYGEVTGTGDHHPVYFVNWEEALAACDRLSIREREAGRLPDGYLYTLPTEAQWEYACRAGTEGPFNVEGASLQDLGWYADNSGKSTHPTAEKTPNGWGLHDCHGNVWEWCADWYQEDLGAAAATDPKGPESGNRRVLRGGSWSGVAQSCRSASRGRFNPAYRYDFIGFRPVLSPRKQRTDLSVLPAELEAVAQPEPPAPTAAGQIRPVFVPIPAGKFLMGSPENEKGRFDDETQHEVTLTRAFEIADAPVTQAQYEAVMGSNPSRFKESGPDAPVEQVSWEDSVAWCRKMSETDPHYEYRLPTEAEWEYVCRAGTTGPYNVDGADLANLGWFDANSGQKTHSVREKAPNTWGLHDCHGNVREWCADRYQKDLGSNAATDPQGPQSGSDRVLRGGSWSSTAQYCRSALRRWDTPGRRSHNIGFRPVRVKKAEGTVLEAVAQPEPEAGARSPRRGLFGGLFGGKR
jgi:formylglycine-generating enzyme required for sulfatase activity